MARAAPPEAEVRAVAGARCCRGGAGTAGLGAAGAAMGDDMDVIPEREMKVRGGGEQAGGEGAGGSGGGADRLGPLSRAVVSGFEGVDRPRWGSDAGHAGNGA